MSLTDRIIGFLMARTKRERILFWVLVLSLFLAIAFLAHTEGIGWTPYRGAQIPEAIIWDLNPVIWVPYGVSGSYSVSIDALNDPYGRTLPPQQNTTLYFLTFLYWIFLALALSKTLTLVGWRGF